MPKVSTHSELAFGATGTGTSPKLLPVQRAWPALVAAHSWSHVPVTSATTPPIFPQGMNVGVGFLVPPPNWPQSLSPPMHIAAPGVVLTQIELWSAALKVGERRIW